MAENVCWIQVDRSEKTRLGLINKSRDNGGVCGEVYPIRFSLLYNRSILALSFSAVIPHHEGTAYISRAILVALVTECRTSSGRPWALSARRANRSREQIARRESLHD